MKQLKKLSLFLLFTLFIQVVWADECYATYNYMDEHHIKSMLKTKKYVEDININGTLHVRYLENNGTNYTLFWLENGIIEHDKINRNSIYAPFLVENSKNRDEFLIQRLHILSKDSQVYQQLLGLIDTFQFHAKAGSYNIENSMGKLNITEKLVGKEHIIERKAQYNQGILQENVIYQKSDIHIKEDKTCNLWHSIKSEQEVKFINSFTKDSSIDEQKFMLTPSKKKLEVQHWFLNLNTNIKSWGFFKHKNPLTLEDAIHDFDKKEQEMKARVHDSKAFEKWIKENLDFLEHLSSLLETKLLDDEVSKKLFALLGYVNMIETNNILSQVSLNTNIIEKERFRSLMGLKNTDAPIDTVLMDELIEYGLNSNDSNDFLQNTTGMILGALAKERMQRYPEQSEHIVHSIMNAIKSKSNKKVALTSAGNMGTSAPDELVESVDNILMSSSDESSKRNSAEALMQIERSTLEVKNFEELLLNENDTETKSKLILASASAKDFKTNRAYHDTLVELTQKKVADKGTRLSALKTLEKADFGNTIEEKRTLRKMMIGERDVKISKMLKKLYRQE